MELREHFALRDWGINRADFAQLLFSFLSLSLFAVFLFSPLSTRVARSFASTTMPTCAVLCARDCPTAKETGQMSVALRGGAYTRFAKLLINSRCKTFLFFSFFLLPLPPLSLSLSLSFFTSCYSCFHIST